MMLYCRGFDSVMKFIAETMSVSPDFLWVRLAQAAAEDHGVDDPVEARVMNCQWLLGQMQAYEPESQWDLVSRVEPLFHSCWEASDRATLMIECAIELYPPRREPTPGNPLSYIMSDEVRLAACDVVETVLQYTRDPRPSLAVATARKYALRRVSLSQMDAARDGAYEARGDVEPPYTSSEAAADAAASAASWNGNAAHSAADAIAAGWDTARATARAAADARNADIVRNSLGTPGLMLLMR